MSTDKFFDLLQTSAIKGWHLFLLPKDISKFQAKRQPRGSDFLSLLTGIQAQVLKKKPKQINNDIQLKIDEFSIRIPIYRHQINESNFCHNYICTALLQLQWKHGKMLH